MNASKSSAFIYGLGLMVLVLAGVAFADLPVQENVRIESAFLQRTPPPTLTPAATPDLTATLFFTQTQTAIAQTATAAATQTAVAGTQTAVAAATQTAARATSLAQTATAAAMQTIIAQTATAAARTAIAQTATAQARTPTVSVPTATVPPPTTPLVTITPLISGGTPVPTVTPPPSSLPSTGLPLSWLVVGGVLMLIAVGARYLRGSSQR